MRKFFSGGVGDLMDNLKKPKLSQKASEQKGMVISMKKYFLLCWIMLVCSILTIPISAAESDTLPDGCFSTANDLFGYWESTYPPQYPDYICGVWTDNGTAYPLTFSVTDDAAGEAGKQEILRLLADDNSVKFVEDKYSRNDLMRIMEEISHYFEQDVGLAGLGVYDMENHVMVEVLQEYLDREETVQLLAEWKQRYGDAISITYTDGYVMYTYDVDIAERDGRGAVSRKTVLLGTLLGGGILGTVAVFWAVHRKRTAIAVMAASGGGMTVTEQGLTRRKIEAAIKDSASDPPSDLEDRINTELNR